jgi:lipoic acid synthetase
METAVKTGKLPPWLKRPLRTGGSVRELRDLLEAAGVETVCTGANCPNLSDCWSRRRSTVLILGNVCTRGCRFCSIPTGRPLPPDPGEPARVAELARKVSLKYLVITSVTRDDLDDGGASAFRDCVLAARIKRPGLGVELLTPDFRNCREKALKILGTARPFIFSHNIETVPRLYPAARPGANYFRSLELLRTAAAEFGPGNIKSSLMLGLGEREGEVNDVLEELLEAGCRRLTVGQYLKSSRHSLEVSEYIRPEKFSWWKEKALGMGFLHVTAAPFARSSYRAEEAGSPF